MKSLYAADVRENQSVSAFEEEAAAALGVAHGIGVANGTDALALALRAVGVEPGDEVICPSYTFYATAEAIAAVGAVPVFADIGADYNLDPAAVEAAVTPRTRAVVAVHLFGHPADLRGAARALRPARPRAGGGCRPGVRRRGGVAAGRRRRDVLVLPDEEPARRSATAA